MKSPAPSALLRKARSAAKAGALPGLLALGAAAAVMMPQEAKAIATVSSYTCTAGGGGVLGNCDNPVQLGDKKVTFLGFTLQPPGTEVANEVFVRYTWIDTDGFADQDFGDDIWTFSVGAPSTGEVFTGPFTLTYQYQIDIVDGPSSPQGGTPPNVNCVIAGRDNCSFSAISEPWYFDTFSLDSDVPGSLKATVVKDVSGAIVLTSTNGQPDGPKSIPGLLKTVVVTDTITVPAVNGAIFSATNTWTQKTQVPGPLPIFGAAMAFGFSRRLRKRTLSVN